MALGLGSVAYSGPQSGGGFQPSSIGGLLEYQQALGSWFSVAVQGGEFGGALSQAVVPNVSYMKLSTVGLAARLWFGALYVGVHQGPYFIATAQGDFTGEVSNRSNCQGFELGLEGAGNWYLSARTDSADQVQVPKGPTLNASAAHRLLGDR